MMHPPETSEVTVTFWTEPATRFDKLAERVRFIHRNLGTDAIVERYIDGRELYVGVMGNQRLRVLPVWEMLFTNMPPQIRRIATNRVKWSHAYQHKHGITSAERAARPRSMAAISAATSSQPSTSRTAVIVGCGSISPASARTWSSSENERQDTAWRVRLRSRCA